MAKQSSSKDAAASKRISEALEILKALGVPKGQQNERSALVLLALLGMTPQMPWSEAQDPMLGITEIMDYIKEHFHKKYAPNTRETVRRYTIHQFVQMELVRANPDAPDRPINSPHNRYQVSPALLKLIREYGTDSWEESVKNFINSTEALRKLQPRERQMEWIPVLLPDERTFQLTAGGQNVLIKKIVEEFCPRFTPGGIIVYVGDTGNKQRHVEIDYLKNELGIRFDEHGKMPDVVVHFKKKNWLILIEAVTSHGPIDLKRQNELKELFAGAEAGLVFVTAFLDRQTMKRYLSEIAWETEAWVAEAPSHIIHFNGERFLGPYD